MHHMCVTLVLAVILCCNSVPTFAFKFKAASSILRSNPSPVQILSSPAKLSLALSTSRRMAENSADHADFKDEWFVSPKERKSFLRKYEPELNDDNDLLEALCTPADKVVEDKNCTPCFKVENLDYGVRAISIQSQLEDPFECQVGFDTLFERIWYNSLLDSIQQRGKRSCVLIGSAGTSKSTYQFWYLFRVLQAIHNSKYFTS